MRFLRADPYGDPPRPALVRVAAAPVVMVALLSLGVLSCGTTDEASRETLPPLETTTTTTTTTTTIPQDRFYKIQPGDSLSIIAELRGLEVVDILNLNPQLDNENDIQAGQTIQLPVAP